MYRINKRNLWNKTTKETDIRLYKTFSVPVLTYRSEI